MTDKKHLIFDMDGTLLHSAPIYEPMTAAFSQKMGLPCDNMKIAMGYSRPLVNDLGWGIKLEDQPAMLEEMYKFHVQEMRNGNFIPAVYPGIKETLKELGHDYDFSLITVNKRAVAFEFLAQNDLFDIIPVKRTLCCAEERKYQTKPSADAVHCLLQETGHLICNSIMIGDSDVDILMAKNAHMKNIAVLYGLASVDKVMATNPDAHVYDPEDLIQTAHYLFNR